MKQRPFVALWTCAVAATVAAFVLHLALRGRTVDFGYQLGRTRAEQARLREVKRVLSLEAASYQTPHRVEMVARTLLGMTPPPSERVIPLRAPVRTKDPDEEQGEETAAPPASASAAASSAPSAPSPEASSAPSAPSPEAASASAPPAPAPSPKRPSFMLPFDPYGDAPASGGIGP